MTAAAQYFADAVWFLRWVLVLIALVTAGLLVVFAREDAAVWKADADQARAQADADRAELVVLRRRAYLRDLADPQTAGRVVVLPPRTAPTAVSSATKATAR